MSKPTRGVVARRAPPETSATSEPTRRGVIVNSRRTNVTIEDEFWLGLREMARRDQKSIQEIVNAIASRRGVTNLSSAIRLEVLRFYRNLATPATGAPTT